MYTISVKSNKRIEFIDVTDQIKDVLKKEKMNEGIAIIYVPHTTAAVTINEGADPDVQQDMLKRLSALVPDDESYSHVEGNSDAHIKTSLLGSSEMVIVEDNTLQLGRWQHIFFFEGDGPRNRKMFVQFIPKSR